MCRNTFWGSLFLAAIIFLYSELPSFAQENTPSTPESKVQQMDKVLQLTPSQKTQILKIYSKASANAQPGRRGDGISVGETQEDVNKILTTDQVDKWSAYTLKQAVDRRMTQIDQAVTLIDDQKEKVASIIVEEIASLNDFTEEMQKELKKEGENADRQAMMVRIREKRTELRDATDKALESILSTEQFQKYKAIQKEGRGGRGGGRGSGARGGRGGGGRGSGDRGAARQR
jgi:hypothetical protein